MTSDITNEEWQRIRRYYGDLAYEHPEMHRMMLALLDPNDLDKVLEAATGEMRAGFAAKPAERLVVSDPDRSDSVSIGKTIGNAKAILDLASRRPT